MPQYPLDELKQKLPNSGWRAITRNETISQEGTLSEMAEAAHTRHRNGEDVGLLKEAETEIEIDMFQLQELWRHMGLPVL